MAFYDLSKSQRNERVTEITTQLKTDFGRNTTTYVTHHFSDTDTYIRKTAYVATGRIYLANHELRSAILSMLKQLMQNNHFHIRQTTVNAAGEIGMKDFETAQPFMDLGLTDAHHTVRNAVIGSVKKMGQKNPTPVLTWAKQYLYHPDKEIRREICHGIELRGRTHPQDILPMLQELEFDKTARVSNTLVHVLGQISYKKGCLPVVIQHLKTWKNRTLVAKAIDEIIDVHYRYRNFSALTQSEARSYIRSQQL
jgi:hypothetical protein